MPTPQHHALELAFLARLEEHQISRTFAESWKQCACPSKEAHDIKKKKKKHRMFWVFYIKKGKA